MLNKNSNLIRVRFDHYVDSATYFSSHKDFVLLSRRYGGMNWYMVESIYIIAWLCYPTMMTMAEDVNDVFLRRAI